MANEELAQEYEQRKERTATLTNLTLQSTEGRDLPPTPTQEENDKLALGLMHPDEKAAPPQDKGMPSVAAQQAYRASGEALQQTRPAAAAAPRPAASPRQPEAPSVPRHPERS